MKTATMHFQQQQVSLEMTHAGFMSLPVQRQQQKKQKILLLVAEKKQLRDVHPNLVSLQRGAACA